MPRVSIVHYRTPPPPSIKSILRKNQDTNISLTPSSINLSRLNSKSPESRLPAVTLYIPEASRPCHVSDLTGMLGARSSNPPLLAYYLETSQNSQLRSPRVGHASRRDPLHSSIHRGHTRPAQLTASHAKPPCQQPSSLENSWNESNVDDDFNSNSGLPYRLPARPRLSCRYYTSNRLDTFFFFPAHSKP